MVDSATTFVIVSTDLVNMIHGVFVNAQKCLEHGKTLVLWNLANLSVEVWRDDTCLVCVDMEEWENCYRLWLPELGDPENPIWEGF